MNSEVNLIEDEKIAGFRNYVDSLLSRGVD